jgi:hypothetical protein
VQKQNGIKSRQNITEEHEVFRWRGHCYEISDENLTFVGPCIVIYFCSKTNQMHNISNLFYFGNNALRVS